MAHPWSIERRICFRFLAIYFVLYIFPFPLGIFSFANYLDISGLWNPLVSWTGKSILRLDYEITVLPNGSGDTTWNYVQVLLFLMLSALGTLVWSIADRKRLQYDTLLFWIIVLVRYYLAVILIGYGFIKIIKTQFPFPFTSKLFQTYGESSPMGLLWTFMGYSTAYNLFTGLFEALGGFLLFFRHTKTIGALLSIAVMSNIVMLNFSYDVPVKLFSLHLLFMSVFVVVPEWRRLADFFIFGRATPDVAFKPVFNNKRWRLAYYAGKTCLIIYVVASDIFFGLQQQKQMAAINGDYSINAIYEVETHIINKDTIPPIMNDTKRWKRLLVASGERISIEYMDNAKINWRLVPDSIKQSVKIMSPDSSTIYSFRYELEGQKCFLRGALASDSVNVTLKRVSHDIPLVSRGFHWINEYPYNR